MRITFEQIVFFYRGARSNEAAPRTAQIVLEDLNRLSSKDTCIVSSAFNHSYKMF